jgi:hypothetical protein
LSQLSRRERLTLLVRWYPEARSQGSLGAGSDSLGDRILLPGELWWDGSGEKHRVWTELERCLSDLREVAPKRYAHMAARYWQLEKRRQPIMRQVKTKSGKKAMLALVKDGEPQYELREVWPRWVDQCVVCKGSHCCKVSSALTIIDKRFRGDPSLPKLLLEAVAA